MYRLLWTLNGKVTIVIRRIPILLLSPFLLSGSVRAAVMVEVKPSIPDALSKHSSLPELMKEQTSYFSQLVGDLRHMIYLKVNPWKESALGKLLCDKNSHFSALNDTVRSQIHKTVQNSTLIEAFEESYLSIDQLKRYLAARKQPNDIETITNLLSLIKEEVITEFLSKENKTSLDEPETRALLVHADVQRSSIQQYALGLLCVLTDTEPANLSTEVNSILKLAKNGSYDRFGFTIARLLLIAELVSDKNRETALEIASSDISTRFLLSVPEAGNLLNSACQIPFVDNTGVILSDDMFERHHKAINFAILDISTRKLLYSCSYRLSRMSDKILSWEALCFLALARAHFDPDGWANITGGWVLRNANINAIDRQGETALHKAIRDNLYTYVKALLDAGANPNTVNTAGVPPLNEAYLTSPDDIIARLLDAGANPNIPLKTDFGGPNYSLMHDAVRRDCFPLVKKLLVAHANPNRADKNGDTPLHTAIRHKNLAIINSLLKYNVDLTLKNKDGHTAWDLAQKQHLDPELIAQLNPNPHPTFTDLRDYTILCIIFGICFKIAKWSDTIRAARALKIIEEKLTTLADKKAEIIHEIRTLISPQSTITKENEQDTLKKLLEQSSIQSITDELDVLYCYRRLWFDDRFKDQWTKIYGDHKDLFDAWDEIYKSLNLPNRELSPVVSYEQAEILARLNNYVTFLNRKSYGINNVFEPFLMNLLKKQRDHATS